MIGSRCMKKYRVLYLAGCSLLFLNALAACTSVQPPPDEPEDGGVDAAEELLAPATWCDVKQTLDARCAVCHNEQHASGAPMSLRSYADLQAAAISDKSKQVYQLVGARVHDGSMPPQQPLTAAQRLA